MELSLRDTSRRLGSPTAPLAPPRREPGPTPCTAAELPTTAASVTPINPA